MMALACIKVEIEFESPLEPNKAYIYTPNHFSYFDITIMAFATPGFYKFIGKKSLGEIPVFGYMFRNLYITIDRESKINSYKALQKGLETLDEGIGLVIFPEGGILSKGPELSRFKDGPFRMGIEKQIPIVPVTIPFNWIFLPDAEKVRAHYRKLKIIFHKPIETSSYNINSLDELKEKTFNIISDRIKKELESEN
jgi:1-acyl-sn-glycerol-3-phosphate acyltransferase